jgi:hypothetical protein
MMGHMKRETGNENKETTMNKSDVVQGIAEMMKAWNTIEARVKAAYPKASADDVYRLTADAMTKAVGL